VTPPGPSRLAIAPLEVLWVVAVLGFGAYVARGPLGLLPGGLAIAVEVVLRRGVSEGSRRRAWIMAAVPLAIGLPLVANDAFSVGLLSRVLILTLIVLSLNVVTGYAGQISIGHAALVGIGAYGTAILVGQAHLHIVVASVAAALGASLLGLLIGVPALRLRGHYLGLVTLAITVAFPALLQIQELAPYTGSYNGLSLFDRDFGPPVQWSWLTLDRWYYVVILAVVAVALFLTRNLLVTSAGRAMLATRDHELAATAAGINVAAVKVLAFTYSAFLAGLGGALWLVLNNRTVAPDGFTLATSIDFLLALVVGGRASLLGSLFGGFFLVYVQQQIVQQFASAFRSGRGTWADWVVVAVVAASVAAWLGTTGARTRAARRVAAQPGAGGRRALVTVATLVTAAAVGWLGLVVFRFLTTRFLDVSALQPTFAGLILLVTVLGMPAGIAGFVTGLDALTWNDVLTWFTMRWWPSPSSVRGNSPDLTATEERTMKKYGSRVITSVVLAVVVTGSAAVVLGQTRPAKPALASTSACGPAGIASAPRTIASLFTINDCVALFKSRPASEDRTGVTKDTILVGRSSPHTGGMAMYLPEVEAIQKVVAAVNQSGGIFGRKLTIVDLDNGGAPARGTDVARQLVEQQKVFAVFNNLCVACELATYQYYASKGVPDVFPAANGPWVAEPTIKTMFGGSMAGIGDGLALARYAASQRPDAHVAVVFQDDAYGQPLLAGFKAGLKDASPKADIVRTVSYNIANVADMSAQAQQAVTGDVNYVAFLGSASAPFMKALRETAGYTGPVVMAAGGAVSNNAIAAGPQNFKDVVAASVFYTTDDLDQPIVAAAKVFASEQRLTFSDYSLWGLAYTEMLIHALQLAGPDLTRQGFVEALETGFKGDWKCALCIGPIAFGPQDHWALETVRMVKWDPDKRAFLPVPGGALIDFETSKGRGIRGNVPGYPCDPGKCPWKK
jgi:branched-chain amino acid transport system permease protein